MFVIAVAAVIARLAVRADRPITPPRLHRYERDLYAMRVV